VVLDAIGAGIGFPYNPAVNLLAVPQSKGHTIGGMTVADGRGPDDPLTDGANMLCEACHAGTPLIENDTNLAYVGWDALFKPNPGFTAYSHPIDDAGTVTTDDITIDYDAVLNWPSPNATAEPGIIPPICESCHTPHPARGDLTTLRTDIPGPINDRFNLPAGAGTGQYILRGSASDICDDCHTATVPSHHPVGNGMNAGAIAIQYPPTLQSGADGFIGNGDATLTCGDCHNGAGAHNWSGPNNVGMDPDWWPVNNGRGTTDDLRESERLLSTALSTTCETCHYMLQTGAFVASTTPTHTLANEWVTEAEFNKDGTATHFLGLTTLDWSLGSLDGGTTAFDASDPVANPTWPSGGWSRFGTTVEGDHLVCESCHELEPYKNVIGSKLLLYAYYENMANPDSRFCEGCHGAKAPPETHVMTGDIVSRTGLALSTTNASGLQLLALNAPTATPLLNPPAPGTGQAGYSTWPGAVNDQMNCDSCHQVHDASTNSATYILDGPFENVQLGVNPLVEGGGNHGGVINGSLGLAHPLRNVDPAGNPDLDYTGFCDQCHWYTKNAFNDPPL
jgi:hypothetical protein